MQQHESGAAYGQCGIFQRGQRLWHYLQEANATQWLQGSSARTACVACTVCKVQSNAAEMWQGNAFAANQPSCPAAQPASLRWLSHDAFTTKRGELVPYGSRHPPSSPSLRPAPRQAACCTQSPSSPCSSAVETTERTFDWQSGHCWLKRRASPCRRASGRIRAFCNGVATSPCGGLWAELSGCRCMRTATLTEQCIQDHAVPAPKCCFDQLTGRSAPMHTSNTLMIASGRK